MSEPEFDVEGVFDENYLYFYADRIDDARSEADVERIWRLLDLTPGTRVLDLACGHGRIANRLAARGCVVTGLDRTALFLDRAREDAATRGVDVDYVLGDMRDLPWAERFDRVLCWFTSYGYFDDEDNRRVLAQVAGALAPGGRFGLDLNHRDGLVRSFQPSIVEERDGDLLIDRNRLEPSTGRIVTERLVVRDGRLRRAPFAVRLFTFTELRDWLKQAGFSTVEAFGEDTEPLAPEHRRMITIAAR